MLDSEQAFMAWWEATGKQAYAQADPEIAAERGWIAGATWAADYMLASSREKLSAASNERGDDEN